MNAEERALRDAYLAELWPVCRELPIGEREAKRIADTVQQRRLEEDMAALVAVDETRGAA